MQTTVEMHKLYFQKTGKRVPIFFNGLKEQNQQLIKILAKQGHYLGVTAEHFTIDAIPLDNTVGQAIGLRVFVENNKHLFDKDGPRLVFISDTYHIRRVIRTFGANSPLFTCEYYVQDYLNLKELSILSKLSPEMCTLVLTGDAFITKAKIYAYGKDRTMMTQLGAEADVQSDLNAITNYSLKQSPPSIASTISNNVMQYRTALVWRSFKQAKFFEDFITRDLAIPFTIAPSIKPTSFKCKVKA